METGGNWETGRETGRETGGNWETGRETGKETGKETARKLTETGKLGN